MRQIRSFGRVWDLERRLRTVPIAPGRSIRVPGQPPLRQFAYSLGLLAFVLGFERVPAVGGLVGHFAFMFKYVAIPFGLAYLAVQVQVDGRKIHHYLLHALSAWRAPTRASAGREIKREGIKR